MSIDIPAKLKTTRRELGLTQAGLAELLDVPANTIARWERGEVLAQHPVVLQFALDNIRRKPGRPPKKS